MTNDNDKPKLEIDPDKMPPPTCELTDSSGIKYAVLSEYYLSSGMTEEERLSQLRSESTNNERYAPCTCIEFATYEEAAAFMERLRAQYPKVRFHIEKTGWRVPIKWNEHESGYVNDLESYK